MGLNQSDSQRSHKDEISDIFLLKVVCSKISIHPISFEGSVGVVFKTILYLPVFVSKRGFLKVIIRTAFYGF